MLYVVCYCPLIFVEHCRNFRLPVVTLVLDVERLENIVW